MTDQISTYEQAMEFLQGRTDFERLSPSLSATDFKLERMRRLLEVLGNPQKNFPAVHIAGTKGKGSTALLAAGTLVAAGYRVGLFTSPHIECYEERIRVNGLPIDRSDLIRLVNRMADVTARIDILPGGMNPTFFELTTAIAWLYFQEQDADIVVLETGLGGRLDTTRLCDPVVCAITTISRDHTQILGSSLSQIAHEKAGIIKCGVPVISGVGNTEARRVIQDTARENQALFVNVDGQPCLINGEPVPHEIQTMWSQHQLENARVALAIFKTLNDQDWHVSPDAILSGLREWKVPARIEIVGSSPLQIIDSAHNWSSALALTETLRRFEQTPRVLVFGTSADKDAAGLLRHLVPLFDTVLLTQYSAPGRPLTLSDLAQVARIVTARPLHLESDPLRAWKTARHLAEPDGLCCVTGSFFLAAEIRRQFR